LFVCPIILMWACSISSGMEVPHWRFSMIRIYLQWQELAWDPKSSSIRFGYSYFMGYEVFNLWFVKHMLHNCTCINSNHSRCLWWGQWELKASKYLIHLKRIYNFWCSMLVYAPFVLCFVTLRGIFMQFSELTYWQDATVLVPYFLLFLCFRKATREIFSELDKTKAETPIFPGRRTKTEREPEGGQRAATP
jgi:hypothetical protein